MRSPLRTRRRSKSQREVDERMAAKLKQVKRLALKERQATAEAEKTREAD